VLGVEASATQREIRDAYRRRARMAHPDLAGDDGASWMRDLNGAWDLLKSPERRAAHDAAAGRRSPDPSRAPTSAEAGRGDGGTTSASSREPWHGAAGAPPGRAYGTVLQVGIYAGWSLGQVAGRDRGYLAWLRDRPEGRSYAAEIDRILRTPASAPGSNDRQGRQPRR
jgi:curved DNA-binding protein CbpA